MGTSLIFSAEMGVFFKYEWLYNNCDISCKYDQEHKVPRELKTHMEYASCKFIIAY